MNQPVVVDNSLVSVVADEFVVDFEEKGSVWYRCELLSRIRLYVVCFNQIFGSTIIPA